MQKSLLVIIFFTITSAIQAQHGRIKLLNGFGPGEDLAMILDDTRQQHNLQKNRGAKNDHATVARLFNVRRGAIIRLFDSPCGCKSDDWVEIRVLKNVPNWPVLTLESTFNDGVIDVTYYKKNGLKGKVSRVEVD